MADDRELVHAVKDQTHQISRVAFALECLVRLQQETATPYDGEKLQAQANPSEDLSDG